MRTAGLSLCLILLVAMGYEWKFSSSKPLAYELVEVPPGSYTLKIPINNSYEIYYVKKPVEIKNSFKIGKYEVSNDQWATCFNAGGCSRVPLIRDGEKGNHPVARVNWHDASEFAAWLSKESGKHYRLPTEEEWAFASNQGRDQKSEERNYDYSKVSKVTAPPKVTLPIGKSGKNDLEIYDLNGNVWEWTLSCWHASEANMLKQRSISELKNPETCNTRIVRGEHRAHISDFIVDTYNGGCATLKPAANLGFRLVLDESNPFEAVKKYKAIKSSFSLVDHNGNKVTEKDFFGKNLLVFFGFTNCTEMCPLGVQKILQVKKGLEKSGHTLTPILISTDPERDTVEKMASYVDGHGSGLIGLTGSEKELQNAAKSFRSFFGKTNMDSTIEHSTIIYFMGKNGEYLNHFEASESPKKIISEIRKSL